MTYIGAVISSDVNCDVEVQYQLGNAQLHYTVF